MRVVLSSPLDLRKEVRLTVAFPPDRPDIWQADVTSLVKSFESFAAAGGVVPIIELDLAQNLISKIEQERGSLTFAWPNFPYGSVGFGVLLRMIDHFHYGKEQIASVSFGGSTAVGEYPYTFAHIDETMNTLPARMPSLPFSLTLAPYGSWISIECDLSPPVSDETAAALHTAILSWGNVANAGGFQVAGETEGADRVDKFGVGIERPTVADNFVQWQCLMTGVPPGSLVCLVNILGHFSKCISPISAVYIG